MGFCYRFVLLGQLLLGCCYAFAQNLPVYSSYYINPYLYNPAEGATEYTYVYLNHRQQWMGIEGAPQLTTFNMHSLLNESHAAIGGKISSYKRGLLTSTDVMLSYTYGISISKKNTFYFGLSGGVVSNTIDVTGGGVDPDDPAIATYLANNIQPSANFGLLYRSTSGVNFGIVIPQLFTPKYNASASFGGTAIGPLDNAIVSLYYKKKVEGKIVSRTRKGVRQKVKTHEAYAPLEFYMLYRYAKWGNSQFEALVKLNVSENFWLAGGYRQAYGFSASTGIAFNKFLLGYTYELGNQPEAGFSSGTHEVQLGLRLGKQKRFKRVAPLLRSTIKTNNEQHTARFQSSAEDPDQIKDEGPAKKKYYVVIRAFGDFTSADVFKKKLVDQKYNANVFYYEKDRKYYVHVLETTKQSEASEEARNLKNYTKLKDAHVLTVTISGK
jgi:type IX secretion system PorP/SprF family membrane protein